jgi:hypothetical protein
LDGDSPVRLLKGRLAMKMCTPFESAKSPLLVNAAGNFLRELFGPIRLTASSLPEPDYPPIVALETNGKSADRNTDGVLIAR